MARRFMYLVTLALLVPSGCDETGVVLKIHAKIKIPDELDAVCLQVVAADELEFARRYALGQEEAGEARTISVVAGERARASFDLLLAGERRGLPVSYERKRVRFTERAITSDDLYVPRCTTPSISPGTARLSGPIAPARLFTDAASVAAVPSYNVPMSLIAPSQLERVAWVDNSWKTRGDPGLPKNAAKEKVNRVIAVDVDGDCDLDLVVLAASGPHLWIHADNDSFEEAPEALPAGGYVAAAAGELNGDGYPDLVLVGPGPDRIKLLYSDPKAPGRFVDKSNLLNVPSPEKGAVGVAVGLLDVRPDGSTAMGIALARGASPDLVAVRKDTPAFEGYELSPVVLPKGTATSTSVVVADLNGDGLSDVAFGRTGGYSVAYFNSLAAGGLGKRADDVVALGGTDNVQDIIAVDLHNDCRLDLVVASSQGVRVFDNKGEGKFYEQKQDPALAAATQLVAGDFDGDGFMELAITVPGPPPAVYSLHQQPQ